MIPWIILKLVLFTGLALILVMFAVLVYALLAGSGTISINREMLYQISTNDALQQGVFDRIQLVAELI